ncbi:MAG TPA: family 6 glucosyltransferase [Gammaproteobacteria bacterium]|jgi:hypothetical protein|nr:family 6 glucosyltransferase [Gammaproteobacteria bacterium]
MIKKDKVAVLYICTGRYRIFWPEFYTSAEKYLLHGVEKKYFVFTDAKDLKGASDPNVEIIHQDVLEYPKNSLLRFDMFLRIKEKLALYDYSFFFNANVLFITDISLEELAPTDEENGLIGYLHYALYNKPPDTFFYERNPISTACIPLGHGTHYYQGCLIGGKTKAFLEMAEILDKKIKEDLAKDFIAIWWDESHLNNYFLDKKVKLLHPGYCYPEVTTEDLPFEKRILARNKSRRGGVDFLRGIDNSPVSKIKFLVKKLLFRF